MLTVTKKLRFCYGHHLPGYEGKCAQYHGHNSEVEVEFKRTGGDDPVVYQGMVIDFSKIKEVVNPIIEELDHRDLNKILRGVNPTAENIALFLVSRIQQDPDIGSGLVRLRITETPDSWAEWSVK